MSRTRFALAALALSAATLPGLSGAATASAPADTVNALHAALSSAMSRGPQLGCEGRIKLLQPAIEAAYNLPFVAERTLRRSWKTLEDSQRALFTTTLRSSFVTTYATEFSTPAAVQFATGTTEMLPSGDALVHSTLTPAQQGPVTLDYILRRPATPAEAPWQVVNVLADGVSDLALRATQYDGLMKSSGFDALMAKLATQTQSLKARCK